MLFLKSYSALLIYISQLILQVINVSKFSIRQARLKIAEQETKAAATTIAQPTSSSTCASHGLPPHRFSKRLACFVVTSLTFNQGFDEKWVEGGNANHMQWPICQCLPRRPATLDGWGTSAVSAESSSTSRSAPLL